MRVAIVEDQTILRESLSTAISAEKDMEVVWEGADAAEAIDPIVELHPDIVLMDVCTEHDTSGIVAAKAIKQCNPAIRVVVMTGMPEVTFVQQARKAGVESFIYKNVSTKELLSVMRSTADGYSTFPGKSSADQDICSVLTDEEIAILRLVCETKSRREIASQLYLSEGTVKRRISEILAKTGYDNILKLAVHAVADGYIVPRMKDDVD